jgi:mannosyl-oligosaccharide alpha-1,2-mannosidase
LGVFTLLLLWYFYYNPGLPAWKGADSSDKGVELWKWAQTLQSAPSKGPADWNARREKVRDAFVVSWEGYEKDAWGELAFMAYLGSKLMMDHIRL